MRGHLRRTRAVARVSARLLLAAPLAALLLVGLAGRAGAAAPLAAPDDGWCQRARITGYVRSEYGPLTYDESPIWTDEPIAAASWNFPLGWHVWVEEVGTFRIADRGMLGSSGWIDIAVWTRADAFALTSDRLVCVYPVE